MLVEGSVIHCGPALWQGAVGLSHHPVGLEDPVQVLRQAGAVVDHHSKFLHLEEKSPYKSSACVLEPAYLHTCKSANVNLCESPPVHIGASNKNMLPVNDPKLAVEDPPSQAAKVHLPHINSFRRETQKLHSNHVENAQKTKTKTKQKKKSILKQNHKLVNVILTL